MCLLIIDDPFLTDGWGCCHCRDNAPGIKTYNGIHRDVCKCCGTPHCPLATNDTPDVLVARKDD